MLVLTRKIDEVVVVGDSIRVKVLGIKGGQVRLGVEAPETMRIYRAEVYDRIVGENSAAADWSVGEIENILPAITGAGKGVEL